jgi:uncharacterized protein with HEPN domain
MTQPDEVRLGHMLEAAEVHGYFDADSEVVWSIVTQDLPELVRQLRGALSLDQTL